VNADRERVERNTRALRAANLDALVCSLPSNILLLSGYWPVVGTSIAVATREGEVALLVPDDEQQLAGCGWADPVESFKPSSLDELKPLPSAVAPPLKNLLQKLGIYGARIGCDAGLKHVPVSYAAMNLYGAELLRLLRRMVSEAKVMGARTLLAKLKSVLTPRETDRVRLACRIAGEAFRIGARAIASGIEEAELAAHFTSPLSTIGAGIAGVNRAGGFAMCMSGANSAEASGAYARSRSRKLRHGDFVLIHCNSYVDGFWTDLTRTFVIGKPDRKQREVQQAIFDARAAALAAIRPGAHARDVDHAARRVLAEHGFTKEFKHSTGHGVGFAAIDANALPRLHPKSPDVLEPGMVFNVEPAIYIEGWGGARHCDTVVVTDDGVDVLSDFQNSPEGLVIG
jgi:Xaa-Pro aminopeptidase